MKRWMQAAALSAALAAGEAPAALAQEAPPAAGDAAFHATTLNLSAYGETKLAPDMATISLGVDEHQLLSIWDSLNESGRKQFLHARADLRDMKKYVTQVQSSDEKWILKNRKDAFERAPKGNHKDEGE